MLDKLIAKYGIDVVLYVCSVMLGASTAVMIDSMYLDKDREWKSIPDELRRTRNVAVIGGGLGALSYIAGFAGKR